MVNIRGECHGHNRGNALLKHAAQLALRVNLCPEGGHSEIVFCADGGGAFLLEGATHHAALGGHHGERHVDTGLDLLRDASPVGGVQSAMALELSGCYPVVRLVPGNVGEAGVGALAQTTALPDGLETKRKLGGDRLEVMADVDAGKTAFEEGRVEGLYRGAKVGTSVLVLELRHVLTSASRCDLER